MHFLIFLDSRRIDNNLAVHASVAEAASVTTLERISAWGLCVEFDGCRLTLFELP